MKNEIVKTISLEDLDAYLKQHNLVIVPASLEWRQGSKPHIQTKQKLEADET